MPPLARRYLHGIVFLIALALIIGGAVTKKYGAWIIGLVVAAVTLWQWWKWNRKPPAGEKKEQ